MGNVPILKLDAALVAMARNKRNSSGSDGPHVTVLYPPRLMGLGAGLTARQLGPL